MTASRTRGSAVRSTVNASQSQGSGGAAGEQEDRSVALCRAVGGAGLAHRLVQSGVDARGDGAQPGAVGAAALLPAPHLGVAGGDQGGPGVDLAGQQAVEGGEQGTDGQRQADRPGQVVLAQADAVLGDEQRGTEEAVGQQPREGGRPGGGGMAQVHSREPQITVRCSVPVEGERAQGTLQQPGDDEQVGDAGAVRTGVGAGRAAGRLQGAQGGLGAERGGEAALVAGEVGEAVEALGETVRLITRGGEGGCQVAEVAGEALAFAAAVGAAGSLRRASGGAAPQWSGPDPADVAGQGVPTTLLLAGAAAQRVDLELVPGQAAHQPVAPLAALPRGVRVPTLGQQSHAHERTPDLLRRTAAGSTLWGPAGGAADGCPSHHRKG
ncbi:hypothetical protein GCM10020221_04180 [Streptomyces thioluteus]|uniref:Uncharacterized protein n=1 Tax=Streptomyces thioluteus TaxID=66431 RepID=A0ABP6IW64_STRTU